VVAPQIIEKSKELDQFLDQAIKATGKVPMAETKFSELAARVARTRKAWDERADKLGKRLDELDPKAEAAFAKHESDLDAAETGIKSMEDAVRDLVGGNNPPKGDSPDLAKSSEQG
jgi:septation ring formation regulator EzrA